MSIVWVILSAAGKITALAAVSLILDLMLSRIHTGRERALIKKEIF
ncbi:MAG: hypothetical protein M1609_02940 [Firmicutes bacterium]|nr:hypothetical protein [Bacillota bacterium]MCL5058263.1 hypothetical protein [Actinomycetota bacterium]